MTLAFAIGAGISPGRVHPVSGCVAVVGFSSENTSSSSVARMVGSPILP